MIVIRYEGRRRTGYAEMLTPTAAVAGMGLDKDMALITDGRFPSNQSAAIGHVSPEAMERGPIAVVRDGFNTIDIPGRKLDLLISEEEMQDGYNNCNCPTESNYRLSGRYAGLVTSASTGAIFREV